MEVVIEREPCYLLEAAELVYSWVNDIPTEKLTGPGTYCIPVPEMDAIRMRACAGLDRRDAALQYYFTSVVLEPDGHDSSCLGCCLLYTPIRELEPNPTQMGQSLVENWHYLRSSGARVTSISGNSLNFEEEFAGGFLSLAQEMAELTAPQSYRMQLLEAFSAYDVHLNRLLSLLEPVLRRLPTLLEPWSRQAEHLVNKWHEFFSAYSAEEFFRQRSGISCESCKTATLRLRYVFPKVSQGKVWSQFGVILFHLGVNLEPCSSQVSEIALSEQEFEALRLIGNPTRAKMLLEMMDKAMNIQELSLALGINPGSVFRDLNSLFSAKLLLLEIVNGRSYYRTNYTMVEHVTDRICKFLQQKSQPMAEPLRT